MGAWERLRLWGGDFVDAVLRAPSLLRCEDADEDIGQWTGNGRKQERYLSRRGVASMRRTPRRELGRACLEE